jgi:predicted ferric reductase
MTEMDKSRSPWKGESGYIDMGMIKRHTKEVTSPVFYIAGPPAMVTGLQSMLNKAGVDDDDIRAEEFSGY